MIPWANLILGPVFTKIINTLFDYLQDQLRWQAGMKDELQRLRNNLPKIQEVFSAANQTDIIDKNPGLNDWIWQLRDTIDEADDLLDDIEYQRHAEQLVSNTEEETNVRPFKSFIDNFSRFGERALHIDPLLKRLVEVVQKLDNVSTEVGTFLHLIDRAQLEEQKQLDKLHENRETGSLPTDVLIGRSDAKGFVLQWLLKQEKPSNEKHQTSVSTTTLYPNISLLSIVGDGGIGKTTLLQHVYKDIMIEFELKIWVCVSNNFDVKKVIAGMLESLKKKEKDLDTLEAFQSKLESEVRSKKFLLVLDDIWEENETIDKSKWEKVMAPLAGGGLGSKILITTRMDSVASMISKVIKKKKEVLILKGLLEDDCLKLLTTHAFADVDNPNDHTKLRFIAEELVKKLSGSPLAAKVVGGVLNSSLDERHWRKILKNNSIQNDIFPILKLSYMFLPKNLQNCFAFCSLYPQDYYFDKNDLVRMWIAVGFIEPSNIQEETLEDIGERYFDILVKKSFFDKVDTTNYKMHDLLHELAELVSKQECFRDVGDKELLLRTPGTIRHLSIKLSNLKVLRKIGKFKNLRTLRIIYDEKNQGDYVDTFNEFFKETRSIRLLDLQDLEWQTERPNAIPEAIGYLMHLRFLRYKFFHTLLPRSLSKLYHLQFIISTSSIEYCSKDDFFPRDMNNLSNLRYLSYHLLNFSGIGKLEFLQGLLNFYVKNEIGYRMEELKHMNDLCILQIYHLENIRDATEACNAKFCDKRKLTDLSLNWGGHEYLRGDIVNPDLDQRVFDNLQPHNCLKELKMNNYMGVRSAVWMNEAHSIENLEKIELRNCLEWQILPPFGHLPFLKTLGLANMPKVKRLHNKFPGKDKYCDFPSLEKLRISELEALEDLFDVGVESWFPCLIKLELYDCPNLQEWPYLPPKLETLKIDNIGWKTLNCCSISKSIPLKTLCVRHCRNIKFISMDGEIGTLAMLKTVEIAYCPNLITLKDHQEVKTTKNCQLIIDHLVLSDPYVLEIEPLRSVTSVRKVTIMYVIDVNSLTSVASVREVTKSKLISFSFEAKRWFMQVSSSLRGLQFENLHSLESLSFSLTSLSSLEALCLGDLPKLQELPDLPASMKQLYLHDLESLQCLPSSLSTISSLNHLQLSSIPLLKSLSELPPSLSTLHLKRLPLLESLPELPPSISALDLGGLPLLKSLPELPPSISTLYLGGLPLLKSLPELPPSLCTLELEYLYNLENLPSCLPRLSSLIRLIINEVPLLRELSHLPPSLKYLNIKKCDPKLMNCYKQFPGFC